MVKLTFNIIVPGKLQEVFNYVGDFANVAKWDPGCVKSTLAKNFNMQKGAKYDVVTVLDGK